MNIAYFKGNILYDVSPRKHPDSLYEDRDIAYNADVLVIDGEKYDMSVKDDVEKIPVLPSEPTWDGVFELSYILKIRCGVEKDPRLIPAFVNKVLALMQSSCMLWGCRDCLQVIRNYYRSGLLQEGDLFEAEFRKTNAKMFNASTVQKIEKEHESTKRYFKQKWDKKHR